LLSNLKSGPPDRSFGPVATFPDKPDMEEEILRLLRQGPGKALSVKEISKLLDRQRFREEANWARPMLQSLLARQLVEKDADGRFYVANTARQ
jgi:hypothetical protein